MILDWSRSNDWLHEILCVDINPKVFPEDIKKYEILYFNRYNWNILNGIGFSIKIYLSKQSVFFIDLIVIISSLKNQCATIQVSILQELHSLRNIHFVNETANTCVVFLCRKKGNDSLEIVDNFLAHKDLELCVARGGGGGYTFVRSISILMNLLLCFLPMTKNNNSK